jgi:nucleoside 2-deoxyribosyltransferase
MSKYYVASPWFDPFEALVKSRMIEKLGTEDYFDPHSTEASQSYDESPGEELARTIYNENVSGIVDCMELIFPYECTDIGTLMEVGIALKRGKRINQYNYLTDSIKRIDITPDESWTIKDNFPVVRLNSLSAAIMLGYNYDHEGIIYYDTCGLGDNIMLSERFTRVIMNSQGHYEVAQKNYEDIA